MINISYVVTIYNKEDCIKEMVEGLKNQIGDFEAEYIFVDDGSTDNSLAILSETTRDLSNVHIVSQINLGPSKALNKGIKLAKCDYIYLLNADHKLLPDATISLINTKKITGCKVIKGIYVDRNSMNKKYNEKINIIENDIKNALRFCSMNSGLIETKLLNQIGGADERVMNWDYSISLRIALATNFARINKILAYNIKIDHQKKILNNKFEESKDIALTRYYFIQDNLFLDHNLKLYGLNVQMARYWSHYKKHNQFSCFNKYFWRYIITRGCIFKFEYHLILRWIKEGWEVYNSIE